MRECHCAENSLSKRGHSPVEDSTNGKMSNPRLDPLTASFVRQLFILLDGDEHEDSSQQFELLSSKKAKHFLTTSRVPSDDVPVMAAGILAHLQVL